MKLSQWCDARPGRHWFVASIPLLVYFMVMRVAGLTTALHVFGANPHDLTTTSVTVLVLGLTEDVTMILLLLILLGLVDTLVGPHRRICPFGRRVVRFLLHLTLLLVAVVPFAADVLLVRVRGMRFTFHYLDLYVRENQFASSFSVTSHDITVAMIHSVAAGVAILVALLLNLLVLNLSKWHLDKLFVPMEPSPKDQRDEESDTRTASSPDSEPNQEVSPTLKEIRLDIDKVPNSHSKEPVAKPRPRQSLVLVVAVPLVISTTLLFVLLLVTHAAPAVVSAAALNNSLNELVRLPTGFQFLKPLGDGHLESAAQYLDGTTETYELFQSDVLYRKTTGFKGPLAFNVSVDPVNPPNVFVIVVESFRYLDSLHIVGNQSTSLLQRQGNITLTPHFDRWAQRGVTFRNFWSSWQTSRSIESILFGQVPYDSPTSTGTTTGRVNVALAGMPQFFQAKGYETVFTSGSHIDYDEWDKFVPAHGFQHVLEEKQFMKRAEDTKNITKWDWQPKKRGGAERRFNWGVHDDLSFEILGDIVMEKVAAQKNRTQHGEVKTPLFLTHYTISSHTPFDSIPTWFQNETLPDFSPLYRDKTYAKEIERYATLRYFTDLQLGKFLDRMASTRVLNDTIVVVVGDHGQSPERGLSTPFEDQIATTRVPAMLIAEGRLGKSAGLVLDDAAEQYDLLNTLADIVGVPDGGFFQSGVGRSLKRASSSTERPVWSNNPLKQLSVVLGHQRLSFDRVLSTMQLHNTEDDPDETTDLFESLSPTEQHRLTQLADTGRQVSRYFRVRWEKQCITSVKC